ncbi:cytochrome P450 [Striga asiatica]|uniref:Cytochrome P450 n=1 Tax=Striga asiatica TaxID=4170 RepID=A0A5A7P875_STRAF|nr:cytochrome P450 [Striga asiatica]
MDSLLLLLPFSLHLLSPYYYHLLTLLFLISLSTLLFLINKNNNNNNNSNNPKLPSGPPGHPVVGNLFQVAFSGKQFFEYARDLIPIYGPIFTLRMGSRTIIVVASASLAHEALIEKGPVFATRPSENPTRTIFSSNKFTVNAALHGPVWRSLRRNMVHNMLAPARVRDFQTVRESAMDTFVSRLRSEASESKESAVWVLKNARFAVFCILLEMCFGVEMDDCTIERVDRVMRDVLLALKPRLDDYFPLLGPFFPKQRTRVRDVRKRQIETLVPLIEKRRKFSQGFAYLDTLFDLKVEGREATEEELVTLCSEFLNGGTDTTATAIEWAVARMIESPEIQTRLYEEIVSALGVRKVEEKDVEQLPYLNAFVKELLRKHPPTYFLLTHAVTERTNLAGYDIMPGANVEFFSQAISDDPNVWDNPERFDPDRFFKGREEADITGVTGVKMMPFGAGRRICPGLAMGTLHISLMLARMVQEFEWSACPDGAKIDFSERLIFTVVMKNSLRAKIKPRA